MKAKVYVTLKPGVLDPQGKAIQHSVELLGFACIADVRQGKYFEIALDNSLAEEQALHGMEANESTVLLHQKENQTDNDAQAAEEHRQITQRCGNIFLQSDA